mmetsp:Transcript_94665/g.263332  ORF Transcript_94665/g.263332 Transcript_94665/m.263332 type:complete len:302 (+) Transcript_94665:196-1101(+)
MPAAGSAPAPPGSASSLRPSARAAARTAWASGGAAAGAPAAGAAGGASASAAPPPGFSACPVAATAAAACAPPLPAPDARCFLDESMTGPAAAPPVPRAAPLELDLFLGGVSPPSLPAAVDAAAASLAFLAMTLANKPPGCTLMGFSAPPELPEVVPALAAPAFGAAAPSATARAEVPCASRCRPASPPGSVPLASIRASRPPDALDFSLSTPRLRPPSLGSSFVLNRSNPCLSALLLDCLAFPSVTTFAPCTSLANKFLAALLWPPAPLPARATLALRPRFRAPGASSPCGRFVGAGGRP